MTIYGLGIIRKINTAAKPVNLDNNEGKFKKFVSELEQISYSGPYAQERNQEALYITERAVFKRGKYGLELIEIAPGLDLQKDIIDQMNFKPAISPSLKEMDPRIFSDEPMNLVADIQEKDQMNVPLRLRKDS